MPSNSLSVSASAHSPPRIQPVNYLIEIHFAGELLAATTRALQVSHEDQAPVFYLPPADIRDHFLELARDRSYCEFKGVARYFNLVVGHQSAACAAWSYPAPKIGYEALRNHVAFYADRVDAAFVDGVRAQTDQSSYGGWLLSPKANENRHV